MNNGDDMKVLYKYRDLKEENIGYVERTFKYNEVYFSKPADFNDPFDSRPKFSLTARESELKNYLNDRILIYFPELSRQQRRTETRTLIKSKKFQDPEMLHVLEVAQKKLLEETGVFCLSAIPDNILMWSHYAFAHTGLCLGFEATAYTDFFGVAQKVNYQMQYPVVNLIKDSKEDMLTSALLTKAKFWKYEQEWRIVLWERHPIGVYQFSSGLLKEVILGARISEENKNKVLSLINDMEFSPKIYEAKLNENHYGITIKPFS